MTASCYERHFIFHACFLARMIDGNVIYQFNVAILFCFIIVATCFDVKIYIILPIPTRPSNSTVS